MPAASLIAMAVGLALLTLIARVACRRRPSPEAIATPSNATSAMLGAALPGVLLALIAPATGQPVYWLAAAGAALCSAGAIGVGREVGGAFGDKAVRLPSLAPVEQGTPGSISAAAAAAAAAAALVLAALAFRVRLIGPSDGALVALSAFFAVLIERWVSGRWRAAGGRRIVPPMIASLAAAAIAGAFVILLP